MHLGKKLVFSVKFSTTLQGIIIKKYELNEELFICSSINSIRYHNYGLFETIILLGIHIKIFCKSVSLLWLSIAFMSVYLELDREPSYAVPGTTTRRHLSTAFFIL